MERIRIDIRHIPPLMYIQLYIPCFFKNECWEMREIGRGAELVSERLARTGSCARTPHLHRARR